ncbi:MAG: GNAT family N-acetyltransferase [Clostridiaceae bacterium]|nr:GNAT family N-acetyltransferase [Clostridiaceae bacterium]
MGNIRSYRNGEETEILNLFNNIFNQKRTIDRWLWQFKENPNGEAIISVVEEEGHILGQCTLIPSMMKIDNSYLKGGQSIDAMVHKDARRKGYFEKLSFHTYEVAPEKDVSFRYSFPSPPSLNGILKKLGGKLVCNIPVYIYICKVDTFAGFFIKNKNIAKAITYPINSFLKIRNNIKNKHRMQDIIVEINNFNADFDILWQDFSQQPVNMTIRSSEFLNWRIGNHPDIEYKTFALYKEKKMQGYIVVKTEEKKVRGKYLLKVGNIVDIMALDQEIYHQLIKKGIWFLKNNDVDFITAWVQEHIPYKSMIKKSGFIKTRSTIPFAVKNISSNKELDGKIYSCGQWYLTPIEADTY